VLVSFEFAFEAAAFAFRKLELSVGWNGLLSSDTAAYLVVFDSGLF